MEKIVFLYTAFIACFVILCFSCPANAEEFKVAVSFTDNYFFLEPSKSVDSKLIVSNMGTVDAQIFINAEIEKDAPFELIVASNPTYVYVNGIYDSHFLIGSNSYGAKEIKFSLVAPYKKIKKEQKKTYKIKLNVFASPILLFSDDETIRTNIKHQYQYEINVDLSNNFTYLREKKMSFYMEGQKSQINDNSEDNITYNEKDKEDEIMSDSAENENETLYFGREQEKEKNAANSEKSFPFITIAIIILGIFGIILALKH